MFSEERGILSPVRLPVPPLQLWVGRHPEYISRYLRHFAVSACRSCFEFATLHVRDILPR
jgi:hypothetical protein